MTSSVSIRNQILTLTHEQLKENLRRLTEDQTEVILNAISDKEWLGTLDKPQKANLTLKVASSLPGTVSTETFFVFLNTMKEAMPIPPKGFAHSLEEAYLFTNWEATLERNRVDYCKEHQVESVSDDTLTLLIISRNLRDSGGVYLKELMKHNPSCSAQIDGMDLLAMGCRYGNTGRFKEILDYYLSRLGTDSFEELIRDRGDEIFSLIATKEKHVELFIEVCLSHKIDPAPFIQQQDWILPIRYSPGFRLLEHLSPFLSYEQTNTIRQAYGCSIVLNQVGRAPLSQIETELSRIKGFGIDPESVMPKRRKNHLTYPEKCLLMLGDPERCKTLVSLTGGCRDQKVKISKSDRPYRSYDLKATRREIKQKYGEMKKELEGKDLKFWQDSHFIRKVDSLIKKSFMETVFLMRKAWEESGRHPLVMESLLRDKFRENPNYSKHLYYHSFIELYHLARGCAVYKQSQPCFPELTQEYEAPFFDSDRPQYHWRQMLLACRFLFHYYGVFPDKLLSQWIKPDLIPQIGDGEAKTLPFPEKRPSYWI